MTSIRTNSLTRFKATVAAIIIILGVTACTSPNEARKETGGVMTFTTVDGVDCVWLKRGYGGGLSCNWEKYNRENDIIE